MNLLSYTWELRCKRFPDGIIQKFKARFCARGDQQIKGVDYFETYSPVFMWTTIQLMLILECLLDLKSKQGDVNCAFCTHNFLKRRLCKFTSHRDLPSTKRKERKSF